jgi:hypothetical protein
MMRVVIHSSETSFLTRVTWCNIPEDGILHSHCHENLKSYIEPLKSGKVQIFAKDNKSKFDLE